MRTMEKRVEIRGRNTPLLAFKEIGGSVPPHTGSQFIPPFRSPGPVRSSTFASVTVNTNSLSVFQLPHQVVPLTLEVGDSSTIKLRDIPFTISIHKNNEIVLSSENQQTPWRFNFVVNSKSRQIIVRFRLDYAGLTITDALEGASFYEGLVQGGLYVISARHPVTGGFLPIVKAHVPAGAYQSNAKLVSLLKHLEVIESKTGATFTFPAKPISAGEGNDIAAIADLLKTGHATYEAAPWVSVTPIEQAKQVLESFRNESHRPMAIHSDNQIVVVLGERVALGPATFFCDRTYIVADDWNALRDALVSSETQQTVNVRFTPFENCPIEARYLNWVSKEEAAQLKELPMYQQADVVYSLEPDQVNVDHALALLESWYREDDQQQIETWRTLKSALEQDRLSDRKLFP